MIRLIAYGSRDTIEQLNKIAASIKELDKPIGQILIEARIVSIDQNKEKELGAQFGSTQTQSVNKLLKSHLKSKANNFNTDLLQHLTMDLPITGVTSINGAGRHWACVNALRPKFLLKFRAICIRK